MKNKNISSPTAARIFAEWEKAGRSERPRTYLGASIVGHECDMYIWLNFRGVVRDNFDGRMYRLLDRGKREEAVFCADLRRIGCEVREFNEKGNQFAVSALGGHFSGHLDGICRGLSEAPTQWFVTEFKTHSDASFRKLCKEGVEKAKPTHYAQMQAYMGHTGLKKSLYMAVDKDNDDLWVETVDFIQSDFDKIMSRAKHIIDTVQPDRCASRQDDFRCKQCPCATVCWHTASQFVDPSIPETCRTCCHSTADTEHEGACWTCRKGHSCTTNGMCSDYLILPVFVKAEVADGDEDNIMYSFEVDGNIDGITIGKRGYSVSEVKNFGPSEKRGVDIVKKEFSGSKVVSSNNLEIKFVKNGEVYFSGTQEDMMEWNDKACIDMTKPISSEEHDGFVLYEYPNDWCVMFDIRTTRFKVYGECVPL